MVPPLLIPTEWLAAVQNAPRLMAVLVLLLSVSMLAIGVRASRFYLMLGAAVGAWAGGVVLSEMMHVTSWYVAAPAAVLIAGLTWPPRVANGVMPVLIALAAACGLGSVLAYAAEVANYWVGFAVGAAIAGIAALLAPRFMRALFFASMGSLGAVGSIGAVVRAPGGLLAPGAYLAHPTPFVIAAVLLVTLSVISQAMLDTDV